MGMIIQADVISLTRATGLGRLRRTSDAPALFGNGGASSLTTEPRAQYALHNHRVPAGHRSCTRLSRSARGCCLSNLVGV